MMIDQSISLFERSSAYARKHGLKEDLQLTPTEDKLAVSLLYVAYVSIRRCHSDGLESKVILLQLIFAVPSVLILLRIDKTVYISILLVGWGSLSIGCAFVDNGTQLIVVQFLLVSVLAR